MNIDVKEFIEQNIDLIENADYYNLFNKWYLQAEASYYQDGLAFREFYNTLDEANIFSCYEDSANVRKSVLKNHIDVALREYEAKGLPGIHITSVAEKLGSYLGFSEHEVEGIIEEYVNGMFTYDKKLKRIIF